MAMGMGMMRGRGRGESFFINDQAMDMNVINYRVKKDTTEIWEIHNDSMMMHPFHIHHSQFQILDRDGVPPAAHEAGLKDTVKVGPGETVRFIMRFENYSDPNTAYMYHCHILEHEDNGMMGQFTVE
jgi:FtsP/CotA-like multicopper oxidase with cupredoxin domain